MQVMLFCIETFINILHELEEQFSPHDEVQKHCDAQFTTIGDHPHVISEIV